MKATTARAIYDAVKDNPQPARAALDATVSETTFRGAVCDLLTARNWRWSYIPDSRKVQGHAGIPDIIAVRGERLLFIELKTERGRLSPAQQVWHKALDFTAAESYVFRPHDAQRIERILA